MPGSCGRRPISRDSSRSGCSRSGSTVLRDQSKSFVNTNVARTFDLGGRRTFQFRMDIQNLLNRQHYAEPRPEPDQHDLRAGPGGDQRPHEVHHVQRHDPLLARHSGAGFLGTRRSSVCGSFQVLQVHDAQSARHRVRHHRRDVRRGVCPVDQVGVGRCLHERAGNHSALISTRGSAPSVTATTSKAASARRRSRAGHSRSAGIARRLKTLFERVEAMPPDRPAARADRNAVRRSASSSRRGRTSIICCCRRARRWAPARSPASAASIT